jgi:amino acid permease
LTHSREVNPGACSFYELAAQVGTWCTTAVELSVIANVFGLATSYLVVIGSTMPYVLGDGPNEGASTSTFLWVTVALAFVTPLSFAPTLDALKFTSALGLAAVVYCMLMVGYFFFFDPYALCTDDDGAERDSVHCGHPIEAAVPKLSSIGMLGIVTFAYTAHVQLLTVANEVADYTQSKMDRIIVLGCGFCGICYLGVGAFGYWDLGSSVNGNVLLSYPSDSAGVAAARIAISGLVGVSYPLMCKPGRDSFLSLLHNSPWKAHAESTAAWRGFTVAFLGLSYVIAASLVNNPNALSLILSLLGGTTSTIVAYLVPTAVFASLHPEPSIKRNCAICVGCFGMVLMPLCVVATFVA